LIKGELLKMNDLLASLCKIAPGTYLKITTIIIYMIVFIPKKTAGFEQIEVEPTRIYRAEDARETLLREGIDIDAIAPQVDGKFMSAFVRALKPLGAKTCCGSMCCA